MAVRPWSRAQPFVSRQKLRLRRLLDYTIHWPELQAVVFTAASWLYGKAAAVGGNRCDFVQPQNAGGVLVRRRFGNGQKPHKCAGTKQQ